MAAILSRGDELNHVSKRGPWWPLPLSTGTSSYSRSLQLIWRSGAHRWNLQVNALWTTCSDLISRKSNPNNGTYRLPFSLMSYYQWYSYVSISMKIIFKFRHFSSKSAILSSKYICSRNWWVQSWNQLKLYSLCQDASTRLQNSPKIEKKIVNFT